MAANSKITKHAKKTQQGRESKCKEEAETIGYEYKHKQYSTKSALVLGYLDEHRVHTGLVKPPSVAQFVKDTRVNANHGFYGARLDEYCKTVRKDERGHDYTIDRKVLNKGAESGRKSIRKPAP
jgi:hypothetical protein